MPYKSNSTNQQSSENKGRPAGEGTTAEGVLHTGDTEAIKRADEIVNKHLNSESEPTQDQIKGSHPNRNVSKSGPSSPPYS